MLIAQYLGAIAARYAHGVTGMDGTWSPYGALRLALNPPASPPLPGASAASPTVHYRTVPLHISSNHLTPWVARGAVCHTPEGVRIRLLNWHDGRSLEMVHATIASSRGRATIPVAIDRGE